MSGGDGAALPSLSGGDADVGAPKLWHPVDITALFHMDFAPGVNFLGWGGGAAELWCWSPPIIPVPPTSLFVAKVNKAYDGSRKTYFIRDD